MVPLPKEKWRVNCSLDAHWTGLVGEKSGFCDKVSAACDERCAQDVRLIWREQVDWVHVYASSTSQDLVNAVEVGIQSFKRAADD
jgi:hypothetical protein